MKNSQPPCHLAWPICDTDRQADICMYKQLSSPLQAGWKHFSLYLSPSRLCWFRPQVLANRMQIIIQHDPQTYTRMYAKLCLVPSRALSMIMNILSYFGTTTLCWPSCFVASLFISHSSDQLCNCPINNYSLFALQMKLIQLCVLVKAGIVVHPTLRFGLSNSIKNCVCNAKTRVYRTVWQQDCLD